MDRPDGRRVLKFDGPSGRGLWIARRAMLKKSALRDLLFCVIGLEKHYGNQPPPVAFFPPWCLTAPPFPPQAGAL